MTPFQSLRDYEIFIYTLPQQFPTIRHSTLVVARRGQSLADLKGDLGFSGGHRLAIYERLTWDAGSLAIEGYSYEVWRGSEKLYWYDSQPHPHDPDLASTHPHHKHIPPDIKHHRVPAPDLSFSEPNIPFLIHEIETTLLRD
ncbi:MAG: DUF6516 family protein [Anaerolineae bacterium]